MPDADVGIVGVPFDSGVSYRPRARFGPAHVRAGSKLLRPFNPALGVEPLATQHVADCGDIAMNAFNIDEATSATNCCRCSPPTANPQTVARLGSLCGDQAEMRWSGAAGRTVPAVGL